VHEWNIRRAIFTSASVFLQIVARYQLCARKPAFSILMYSALGSKKLRFVPKYKLFFISVFRRS
jgi:hypothetical protein